MAGGISASLGATFINESSGGIIMAATNNFIGSNNKGGIDFSKGDSFFNNSFNPLNTNPVTAYSADVGVSVDGLNVIGWSSMTFSTFNLTPVSTPPIIKQNLLNGLPGIRNSGIAILSSSGLNALNDNSPYTKIVVISVEDVSAINNVLTVGNSLLVDQSLTTVVPTAYNNSVIFPAGNITSSPGGVVHLLAIRYGAGTGTNDFYINNTIVANELGTVHSYTGGGVTIFNAGLDVANLIIGEAWVWDSRLDDTTMEELIVYFTTKYGISI